MIIVHIESGLGNQMLSFCEYLALKFMNNRNDIYIETIIYEIHECNETICQWNGYALQRVFGLKVPNIKDIISDKDWETVISEVRKTRFWEHNWNYPIAITNALKTIGINVENSRGNFEAFGFPVMTEASKTNKQRLIHQFGETYLGDYIKRCYCRLNINAIIATNNNQKKIFRKTFDSIFTGQRLSLRFVGNGIEKIDSEIKKTFVFPEIIDNKNINMASWIQGHNVVAIHARRGDMLGTNGFCYKTGYFKRAVKFIRKHVNEPVFVFFCDPDSIQWCKSNINIFGLYLETDIIRFVDWNKGLESYRDMQLMSMCKHAIITNSSFGWWGAYFIKNPNKITISPQRFININTTHHF